MGDDHGRDDVTEVPGGTGRSVLGRRVLGGWVRWQGPVWWPGRGASHGYLPGKSAWTTRTATPCAHAGL